MMFPGKAQLSWFRVAVCVVGLASLGVTQPASASSTFPAALKAALDQQFPADKAKHCVPLCTACHLTTTGGPGNTNVFGQTLKADGLILTQVNTVLPAIQKLAMADPATDSDHDGIGDLIEINNGDSPSIAGDAGKNQFCPDIEYGCGAHIAVAPPVDRLSLFPAGLVVLGLAAIRRVRSGRRAKRAAR